MDAQGFKLSLVLVIAFFAMAMASLYALSVQSVTLENLSGLFQGMGILAAMFGIPGIISAYIVTRGATMTTQEVV